MRARTRALVAVALATAAAGAAAAPAQAAAAARITIVENTEFEPGGPLVFDWGYAPGNARVPSGSTVRWNNPSTAMDPHTVTVVRESDVPQTVADIFGCFEGLCGQVAGQHFPEDAEPVRRVNVGRSGLNRRGDSRLLFPGESVWATVSAPSGSTLHYLCALHPWMQARLTVT